MALPDGWTPVDDRRARIEQAMTDAGVWAQADALFDAIEAGADLDALGYRQVDVDELRRRYG